MTKKELVAALAESTGLTQKDCESVVAAYADTVKTLLEEEEKGPLPGIGKFVSHTNPARKGRNPATGEPLDSPAKDTIKFKPSKALTID